MAEFIIIEIEKWKEFGEHLELSGNITESA